MAMSLSAAPVAKQHFERAQLSVDRLSYAIGDKAVLKDISVQFQPGSFTALLGPNGAGKSTLLKAL